MITSDWIEIGELKARYCRLMDMKDWVGYADCFTEDYVLDVSGEGGMQPVEGREAAIASVRGFIEEAVTVHQVHSPEITIMQDEATGIWAMQDRVIFPGGLSISGFGHYHEQYVKQDGRWRISRLRLSRLHIDIVSAPDKGP